MTRGRTGNKRGCTSCVSSKRSGERCNKGSHRCCGGVGEVGQRMIREGGRDRVWVQAKLECSVAEIDLGVEFS